MSIHIDIYVFSKYRRESLCKLEVCHKVIIYIYKNYDQVFYTSLRNMHFENRGAKDCPKVEVCDRATLLAFCK